MTHHSNTDRYLRFIDRLDTYCSTHRVPRRLEHWVKLKWLKAFQYKTWTAVGEYTDRIPTESEMRWGCRYPNCKDCY